MEVVFMAIRKDNFIPYADMYLGEGGVVKVMDRVIVNKETFRVDDAYVVPLGDWKNAIDLLISIEDSFYAGNYGNAAIELINRYQDQMVYFLRVS